MFQFSSLRFVCCGATQIVSLSTLCGSKFNLMLFSSDSVRLTGQCDAKVCCAKHPGAKKRELK